MKLLLTTLVFFLFLQTGFSQSVQIIENIKRRNDLSGTVELAATRFISLRNVGTVPRSPSYPVLPQEVVVYKYNKTTNSFVDSLRLFGDTVQTDSIVVASPTISCYKNGRIYYLNSKVYLDGSIPGQHLIYSVIDTNLNVIVPEQRISSTKLPTLFRQLYDLRFHNEKLFLLYTYTYKNGSLITGRVLELDLLGQVLKDTVAGIMPDTTSATNYVHRPTQIVKDIDEPSDFFIAGEGLNGNHDAFGMYRTDTTLGLKQGFPNLLPGFVLDTLKLSYEGFPSSIGYSDIQRGVLFSGGNFAVTSLSGGGCYGWEVTALHRHLKANNYLKDKTLFILNNSCSNYTSGGFFYKNIFFSEVDKVVYYANTNHDGPSSQNTCDTTQNYIQVVCVDTGLSLKWKKFISPKSERCVKIASVLQPIGGSGITVTGVYLDAQAPTDNSLKGSFIIHIDSTGTLDVASQPHFAIRNRFNVYPNPAKEGFWVEDIAGVPAKAFLYDLAGRQVGTYNFTGRKNFLALPAGSRGMLLLRIVPQWGEGWSQMVQVVE